MSSNEPRVYIGYHGTNADHVESIVKNGFYTSDNADEWLGHGIYFFTEGISDPIENAKEWAINQAWDKVAKRYLYQKYAVLKVEVSGERVLDLTTTEGLQTFNVFRNFFIEKASHYFRQRDRSLRQDNCKMHNLIMREFQTDILFHHLYIKNRIQRQLRIDSNVPNTTVMVVTKPVNVVSIEVVTEGKIR